MAKIYKMMEKIPQIDPNVAFISENAVIIGDVEIGTGVTIFDNVVLEGFPMKIKVGNYSNIQSGSIIHGLDDSDTIIGEYCTIGHNSLLHGCNLGDYVTVGLGSTLMGGSKLEKGCFVAAKSLITQGKTFSERSFLMGSPAQKIKELPEDSINQTKEIALKYVQYGELMKKERVRI